MERKDMRRADKFSRNKKHYSKNPSKGKPRNSKFNRLQKVWLDTEMYCLKNFKKRDGYKIPFDEIEVEDDEEDDNIQEIPTVEIQNMDTLDMATNYVEQGMKVLVLNMASEFKPGGGVRNGRTAQEEELFRRTNAFLFHNEQFYPLENDELVYADDVTVIKDSSYNLLTNPFKVGMVTCPGLRKPKLVNGELRDGDYQILVDKVEAIFKLGVVEKYDCLILGALGCGVFKNPVEEVAKVFKLMVDKYGLYFDTVGFAILTKRDKDRSNYEVFKQILI